MARPRMYYARSLDGGLEDAFLVKRTLHAVQGALADLTCMITGSLRQYQKQSTRCYQTCPVMDAPRTGTVGPMGTQAVYIVQYSTFAMLRSYHP